MRDDPEFNIKFCEVVQTFPCLYDNTRSDYSNRASQDQAWKKVGEQLKERSVDCKDRWKNIRGRYVKCKNQHNLPSGSGAKRLKHYYLTPHLHFLDSFLKSRDSKSNIVDTPLPAEDQQVNENFEEDNDEDEELRSLQSESHAHEPDFRPRSASVINDPTSFPPPPSRAADDGYRKRKRVATMGDVNSQAIKYFERKEKLLEKKHSAPEKSEAVDPDLAFLQSLLPDMKAMDDRRKRRLKIEVLQLADRMLESEPASFVSSPSTFEGSLLLPNPTPEENNEGHNNFKLSEYVIM